MLTCDIHYHAIHLFSLSLRSDVLYWFVVSSFVIGRKRPFFLYWIFCLSNFKLNLNTVGRFPLWMLNKPWQEQNCALLGYYAAYGANLLPTFRNSLSFPSSVVSNLSCPETSARNYHSTRCVITQKSAVLIHFAAGAWNHANRGR